MPQGNAGLRSWGQSQKVMVTSQARRNLEIHYPLFKYYYFHNKTFLNNRKEKVGFSKESKLKLLLAIFKPKRIRQNTFNAIFCKNSKFPLSGVLPVGSYLLGARKSQCGGGRG